MARTVATAGRTVAFSATLLMIALAGLLLFPQGFLKSLAYGGLAAVSRWPPPCPHPAAGVARDPRPAGRQAAGAPGRRSAGRRAGAPLGHGWPAVVLRRPVLVAVPLLAALLVLAAPIRGVRFGETDERALPAGDPARQAIEIAQGGLPGAQQRRRPGGAARRRRGGPAPRRSGAVHARRWQKVPGIAVVNPAGTGRDVRVLTATLGRTDPFSAAARDAVDGIRALPAPAASRCWSAAPPPATSTAWTRRRDRLPLMMGLLVGATLC